MSNRPQIAGAYSLSASGAGHGKGHKTSKARQFQISDGPQRRMETPTVGEGDDGNGFYLDHAVIDGKRVVTGVSRVCDSSMTRSALAKAYREFAEQTGDREMCQYALGMALAKSGDNRLAVLRDMPKGKQPGTMQRVTGVTLPPGYQLPEPKPHDHAPATCKCMPCTEARIAARPTGIEAVQVKLTAIPAQAKPVRLDAPLTLSLADVLRQAGKGGKS